MGVLSDRLRILKAQIFLGLQIQLETEEAIVSSRWTEEEEETLHDECMKDLHNPEVLDDLERDEAEANRMGIEFS